MLFKIRWDTDDRNEREAFLNSLDLGMAAVPVEEAAKIKSDLFAASGIKPKVDTELDAYYKVHWTRVTDLVATRRVLLKGGYAYVPAREQSSIVFQEFSTRLERALEVSVSQKRGHGCSSSSSHVLTCTPNVQQTSRAVPRLDEDDRLLPLLQHLAQSFLNGIASSSAAAFADENGELVRAEQVDELAPRHFPACMRNLHDALRKDHHLRHHGRLQYGLFLKASLNDHTWEPCTNRLISYDAHMRRVGNLRATQRPSVCQLTKHSLFGGGDSKAARYPTTNSTKSIGTISGTVMASKGGA